MTAAATVRVKTMRATKQRILQISVFVQLVLPLLLCAFIRHGVRASCYANVGCGRTGGGCLRQLGPEGRRTFRRASNSNKNSHNHGLDIDQQQP